MTAVAGYQEYQGKSPMVALDAEVTDFSESMRLAFKKGTFMSKAGE